MSNDSIESVEELRERLAEAQEALDRAEREQEKIERLNLGLSDENDEEPELVQHGIDNFFADKDGGIYIGGERVGGPDVVDDRDPHQSATSNYGASPAELQRLGLATKRDEGGRFVANEPPPEPLWREPCSSCGRVHDMNQIHPSGAAWNLETGESFVRHDCQCGESLLTEASQIPDKIQAEALFESEVLGEILEHHMERPPKW